MYNETREQNMLRVAACIRTAKSAVTHILSEQQSQPEDKQHTMTYQLMRREQTTICTRIMQSLTESMIGLDNLMETYRDDTALVVRIRQIKGDVTDFIENTQIVAQSSPVMQRLTE